MTTIALPSLRDRHLLGMALFIGSESVFFLGVVMAYLVFRGAGLALARQELDLGRTALFSVLLFSSSGTVARAVRLRSRPWLALTGALGAVFLAGQAVEYARLVGAGFGPASALFATTFFTLTGLHALHVLVGLALLGGLFLASGRSRRLGPVAWEAVGLYWHFVDAVWVVVFGVVYLGTAIG